MLVVDLAKEKYYVKEIKSSEYKLLDYPTLAAFNLTSFVDEVVPQIDALGRVFTYSVYYVPETAGVIHDVWSGTDRMGDGEFPDLYNFSENILSENRWDSDYDPRPIAQNLINALEDTIIAYWHGPGHPGAHGLSIYIPPSTDDYLTERYWYFEQTLLPVYTWWGLFLDYYFWRLQPPTEELTIVPATPAFVNKDKEGYAFVGIRYGGTMIDPDYISVTLVYPNGSQEPLEVVKASDTLPGVYVVKIPAISEDTTVMLLIEVSYWFLDSTTSAAVKVTEISSEISNMGLYLGSITKSLEKMSDETYKIFGSLLAIQTAVGTILTTLDSLHAQIEKISDNIVYIKTDIGTIKTTLDSLNTEITNVGNNVVEIKTSLGTIKGTIESIDGNVVTIKTDLGTVKTTVDNIKGTVSDIKGETGTIASDVSEIKESVSDVSENVSSILDATVWYYIIAVLLIISIILQIVILVRKK